MKRSIKSVIAAAAAAFMCTAPAMASVPVIPAVSSITASAYYTPNAFESFADNWTPEIRGLSGVTCNLGHVDYEINFSNNTAAIKSIDRADSRIKIPAQLKVSRSANPNTYYTIKVTAIDNQAFKYKDGKTKDSQGNLLKGAPLTKIDLSAAKYLDTIGNEAFYGCTSLTSVTIPASVTKINTNAFAKSGLQTIRFESVSATSQKKLQIGHLAFADCTSLRTITNNVTRFDNSNSNAFDGCKKNLITVGTTYRVSGYKEQFINNFKKKFNF